MDPSDYTNAGFVVGADKQSSRGVDIWGEDGNARATDAARYGSGGPVTMLVLAILMIVLSLLMG